MVGFRKSRNCISPLILPVVLRLLFPQHRLRITVACMLGLKGKPSRDRAQQHGCDADPVLREGAGHECFQVVAPDKRNRAANPKKASYRASETESIKKREKMKKTERGKE